MIPLEHIKVSSYMSSKYYVHNVLYMAQGLTMFN